MNFKGKMQRKSGITLISLVVTIIVLLILAGVSIATLAGPNGILTRANEAKEETQNAEQEERYNIARQEDFINEYTTGIEVEQVTDQNPGVLETDETNANTFIINSIEDLVFFAYDVTNGNNYEGKTVKLGLSLDFNSTKSYVNALRTDYAEYGYDGELKTLLTTGEGFKPIGLIHDSETQNFYGTFDGQGNTINNLYINVTIDNEDGAKYGFFSNNRGTIHDLKLYQVNLYLKNSNLGALAGISGQNSITGNIYNCVVSGNIKNESSIGSAGGITCWNSGHIENCGNLSNVTYIKTKTNSENDNIKYGVGGICYSSGGYIQNSYNMGNIYGNSVDHMYVGGIVATTTESSVIIENCYNTGSISGKAFLLKLGGIVGNSISHNKINNCYNVGKVNGEGIESLAKGFLVGECYYTGVVTNSYYKKSNENEITGIGNETDLENMPKTEQEMKSNEFINLLNQNSTNMWKKDTNNINNGYPILNWQ